MKNLFGDDSVNEQTMIDDNNKASGEMIDEMSEEQNQSAKAAKPAWLKKKKGQKKSHKKSINKKAAPTKNIQTPSQTVANNTPHTGNALNAKKKEDKSEKESSKEKLSDISDSEIESDRSDDEDSHDKKDISLEDDDTEWEK